MKHHRKHPSESGRHNAQMLLVSKRELYGLIALLTILPFLAFYVGTGFSHHSAGSVVSERQNSNLLEPVTQHSAISEKSLASMSIESATKDVAVSQKNAIAPKQSFSDYGNQNLNQLANDPVDKESLVEMKSAQENLLPTSAPVKPVTHKTPLHNLSQQFAIQVGLFSDTRRATQWANNNSKRFDYYLVPVKRQARIQYSIILGTFENKDSAREYLSKYKRQTHKDAFITQIKNIEQVQRIASL